MNDNIAIQLLKEIKSASYGMLKLNNTGFPLWMLCDSPSAGGQLPSLCVAGVAAASSRAVRSCTAQP